MFPRRVRTLATAIAATLAIIDLFASAAAAQTKPKNVLVLSGGRGRVSINLMQSSLRARFPEPVNFSIVDLENPRFDQPDYQEHFAEALRSGYAGEKLDLIVAVMTPSLEFAVNTAARSFRVSPSSSCRSAPRCRRRCGRE